MVTHRAYIDGACTTFGNVRRCPLVVYVDGELESDKNHADRYPKQHRTHRS